jgi:hypothetical protein
LRQRANCPRWKRDLTECGAHAHRPSATEARHLRALRHTGWERGSRSGCSAA